MINRKNRLTSDEFARALSCDSGQQIPVTLSPSGLAKILGVSVKTIYYWIAKGRFEGTYRKRGKRVLFWRDRALDAIFNGREWTNE